MIINYVEASHEMKNVTGLIDKDVFDLGGIGLLIIGAYGAGNEAGSCAQVRYELLDETEREEWFLENTPSCGNKEHVGWACDKNGCYPF